MPRLVRKPANTVKRMRRARRNASGSSAPNGMKSRIFSKKNACAMRVFPHVSKSRSEIACLDPGSRESSVMNTSDTMYAQKMNITIAL